MNNEIMSIIFLFASLLIELLGWVIVHLLCEFKYYWCDGQCVRCRNWRCKFYKSVDENGNCLDYQEETREVNE